jgi:hypothetical protein
MLAVVTCHWNPANWASLRRNYRRFIHEMSWWGVPTFAAEVAFTGQSFVDEDAFLQLLANERHQLWQKERLINRLVELLPDQYDAVAWIDADVLFLDPKWTARTVQLLEEYPVVQLWDRWHDTDASGRIGNVLRSVGEGAKRYTSREPASPGGAWAARREVFPLYDRMIVGSGDAMMVEAWAGMENSRCMARCTPAMAADYGRWAAEAYAKVGGRIGILPGHAIHLHHGSRKHRSYVERWQPVIDAGYDPQRHVAVDDNGLLRWTDECPQQLRDSVAGYFASRREDDEAPTVVPTPVATHEQQLPVVGGPWNGQRYPRTTHRYACISPTVPGGYHWYELTGERWTYVGATDDAREPVT